MQDSSASTRCCNADTGKSAMQALQKPKEQQSSLVTLHQVTYGKHNSIATYSAGSLCDEVHNHRLSTNLEFIRDGNAVQIGVAWNQTTK